MRRRYRNREANVGWRITRAGVGCGCGVMVLGGFVALLGSILLLCGGMG